MNGIDIKNFRGADDGGNVEITFSGGRGANTCRLIGKTHVERLTIDVAMHRHRSDSHLLAGPDNPARNFAAISDQDLLEFSKLRGHISWSKVTKFGVQPLGCRSKEQAKAWTPNFLTQAWTLFPDPEQWLAVFDRLAVFDVDLRDFTAGLGLDFVHQFHRLDDANHRVGLYHTTDLHKRIGIRGRRTIKRSDNR